MYSALIFVGIISLSTCRPETQSHIQQQEQQTTDKPFDLQDCPHLQPKHPFNATAYFRDVWYMVSGFYPDTETDKEDMKCIKFTSQILDNGNVRQLYTQFLGRSELRTWPRKTNIDDLQSGKYVSRPIDEEGNLFDPIYSLRTTVIETDYSNFAIEYRCLPLRKGLLHVYLILNRKPYIVDPNVEPILNKLELKLQDFVTITKPHCD